MLKIGNLPWQLWKFMVTNGNLWEFYGKLGVIETNCIISKLLVYHIEMRHFICPYKILVAMQVKHIHDLHPPLSLSLCSSSWM